jgi:hypothetical protein
MLHKLALLPVAALLLATPSLANSADVGGNGSHKTTAHATEHKPVNKTGKTSTNKQSIGGGSQGVPPQ